MSSYYTYDTLNTVENEERQRQQAEAEANAAAQPRTTQTAAPSSGSGNYTTGGVYQPTSRVNTGYSVPSEPKTATGLAGQVLGGLQPALEQGRMTALGAYEAAGARTAPTMDARAQEQFRRQQMGLASTLWGGIQGNSPSVAELMYRRSADDAAQSAAALAAGTRGANPGLAMRQALNAQAMTQGQAALGASQLRAQEIAQQRGELAQLLAQGRGMDIGIAGANQQAALEQQRLNDAAQQGYLGMVNQQDLARMNATNSLALAEMGKPTMAEQAWGMGTQAVGTAGALWLKSDARLKQNPVSRALLSWEERGFRGEPPVVLGDRRNVADVVARHREVADAPQLEREARARGAYTAQMALDEYKAMDQEEAARQRAANAHLVHTPRPGPPGSYAHHQGYVTGSAFPGVTGRPIDLSRSAEEGRRTSDEFLRTIRPHRYEYRDPGLGPGPRTGVMAQELTRSEAGRQMVRRLPDGTLAIDTGEAVAPMLAAMAQMDDRLRKVEGQ